MAMRLWSISLLNLLDVWFTAILVAIFGVEIELNPFGTLLFHHPDFLVIYKLGVVNALLLVVYYFRKIRISQILSYAVLCIYLGLVGYHIYGVLALVNIFL